MPKINRIRIVNFSYNNDNRQIIDETFNFFEGENALLNLANGGGKSVLVQLMLQPVAPKSKIQGRNFSDFFKNKKQPTFILTEWKLDYSEDYLLTGFICQNFETNQLDGEKNQRLRFLTFTSKYNQSNSWDIQNLKLIEKQGKILNIPNFREILKTLEEKERKSAIDFRVFNDDNMEEYRKHIAEFGISSDEWKNIIKAINDSEGGLEEIFLK
ncbi:MAG: chromosome partitioning protein ParA, partial [Candidatus Muiribacteriota bacterium]